MCGIAGLYKRSAGVDDALVRAMTDRIVHRGPDGEGFHRDEKVELGMRRLAIVDLEHGGQPLYDERREIAVVFNGEIYNHEELRRLLEDRGHQLSSHSDGAILPHLYEEFGEGFVDRLNGIFAIALWDSRSDRLYLVRDQLGVKPLYWARSSTHLAFCSEIRGLLADSRLSRDLDHAAIDDFLTYRFVPAPRTPLAAVRKVRPGCMLVVGPDGESERRHWHGEMTASRRDADDLVEEYSRAFETAVVRQMMSDRPIGVMLSGGVDSAAVTAVMARHSSQVRTFTIGFEGDDPDSDETDLAGETSKLYGTRHESLVVSATDYLKRLPSSYATLEEPVGTSSALAVNYVAELMRPDVPVALSGQGADELMAGYWRYVGIKLAPLLAPAGRPARRLASVMKTRGRGGVRLVRGIGTLGVQGDLARLMAAYQLFGPAQKAELYRPSVAGELGGHRADAAVERLRERVSDLPQLDQMLYVDTRLWLPDELLLIADKMSMAASVELRVPFLDRDLVALAESMSGSLKVRRLTRKYLHKRAMARWVPRAVVHRKERGWSTPMSAWLRGELRPVLAQTLLGEGGVCRELFVPAVLERLIDEHCAGTRDRTRELFSLLSLGLWHEAIVKGA